MGFPVIFNLGSLSSSNRFLSLISIEEAAIAEVRLMLLVLKKCIQDHVRVHLVSLYCTNSYARLIFPTI